MSKYLCIISLILCSAANAIAQAGFEEEMLPDIFKVHGNVKMVVGTTYRPESFADTLGKGIAESRGVLYYDNQYRLIKQVGNDVKYRKYPDFAEYYSYFGKDSIIKSTRKGDISSSNTFVTVNRYDDLGRLKQQEFYRNRPRKLSAIVVNTYDNRGFLIKQLHKGETEKDDLETAYINDVWGNHLQILPPRVNASMQTKRTLTYDQHNNITSIIDYPYSEGSYRAFCYVYDDHGNWIKQTEYNDPKCHASRVLVRQITYYQ